MRLATVVAEVEYFDEGAAQVKRLLDRDRKELANEAQPKAEYETEFDLPAQTASRDSNGTASPSQSSAISEGTHHATRPL